MTLNVIFTVLGIKISLRDLIRLVAREKFDLEMKEARERIKKDPFASPYEEN